MHLQSSSEFLEFLKLAGKGFNHPGHVSYPESTREGGLGVGFRDTWCTRTVSGGFSRLGSRDAWRSRTTSGGFSRLELSGRVAHSHSIRRVLSARALGTRGTLARNP